MCEPNIEEIVTYLSTKFNKIFCDREFVCCVSNDFHILKNKNKCRVLVFPTLGPVYQRALKYQAEAFDFATFELSAGIFKTIAVCQKEHILRKEKQDLKISQQKNMSSELSNIVQESSGRKKRPERQLYVPPAQRRIASTKGTEHESKQCKQSKSTTSDGKATKIGSTHKTQTESNTKIRRKKSSRQVNEEDNEDIVEIINICEEGNSSENGSKSILSLLDLIMLDLISLPTYNMVFYNNSIPSLTSFHDSFCEFHQYLNTRYKNDLKLGISIFHLHNYDASLYRKDKICWQTFFPSKIPDNVKISEETQHEDHVKHCVSSNLTVNQTKLCSKIQRRYSSGRSQILQNDFISDSSEVDIIFGENCAISEKFSCDSELFENIVDLTDFDMGHYFKIKVDEKEHFHICYERHNVRKCYMEVERNLVSETKKLAEQAKCTEEMKSSCVQKKKEPEVIKISEVDVKCSEESKNKSEDTKETLQIGTQKKKETRIIKTQEVESKPIKGEIKIEPKKMMDSRKKCQHDEEIEIMRKTKENINRKTRPLMKYSDDSDDLLRIDKQDNVNNWEDLFDEEGQIQEELLTEIVHKVGKEMTIVKATEDYTPYMPKPTGDLDHVVEIYNFPSSLSTGDIIHAFNMFDSNSMYVVWVDETHALLVLGSSSQAQKAVELKNPFIKVRPLSSGSVAAMTAASKYDLKPAMKRPETNLQTARRLITTHLGTKSQISKEQRAQEREHLRKAREQKKLIRQNERDAWEGNIH